MDMSDAQELIDRTAQEQIPWTAWSFNHDAAPSMLVYQGKGNHIGIDLIPSEWGLLIRNNLAPIPGDVNMDGTVGLADALLALQSIAGISPDKISFTGDTDEDLKLGLADVVYIMNKLNIQN
jgi:hypothetical protein